MKTITLDYETYSSEREASFKSGYSSALRSCRQVLTDLIADMKEITRRGLIHP